MTDDPNDLAERARRSAQSVRLLAARMAAGVGALADLPPQAHPRELRGPRRVRTVLVAAAILGLCAVGVVALTRNTGTATVRSAESSTPSTSFEASASTGGGVAASPSTDASMSTGSTASPTATTTTTTTIGGAIASLSPASDGCDAANPPTGVAIEELPTFMTMAPAQPTLEYTLSANPTTVCAGGTVTVTITVHNSASAAVEVAPRLVMTHVLPHIDLASAAAEVVEAGGTATIVQAVVIPQLDPGAYAILVYGSHASAMIEVVESPAEQPPATSHESVTTAMIIPDSLPSFDPVTIPFRGGDALAPVSLTTIPFGSAPGELILQNGEFLSPIALLPDHIVVFEDEPFAGLTGRALLFDRDGVWLNDVSVPDVAGSRVSWLEAAPNGTLFVAFSSDIGSHLDAFTVNGTELARTQTVPFAAPTPPAFPEFSIEAGGVKQTGVGWIMEVETSVALDATTVNVSRQVDGATAVVTVVRAALNDSGSWTIIEEIDEASTTAQNNGRFADFGDGVWFADVASDDPMLAQPFIVLLSSHSDSRWYRLGPWAISGGDGQRILLSRTTVAGLEIAALDWSAIR